jgi:hypothetical protein
MNQKQANNPMVNIEERHSVKREKPPLFRDGLFKSKAKKYSTTINTGMLY